MQAEAASLERLRGNRVRADRGRGLGDELTAFVKGIKKISGQAERAAGAWGAAAPDVAVRSAADRHAADRWVRGGGLADLKAIAKAPITRVRFVLTDAGWSDNP